MGLFFSRYKKNQRSSKDILEELESSIKSLTESKGRNAQYERSFIGYLLITSFFSYLIGALIYYLYFLPTSWVEGVLYTIPLALFPVIVYLVKKLLNIYFFHRTTQFDAQLRTLHEEKRKTLNEVMEKETYKTARELLEKFDPSNPSLQSTPARAHSQRSSNQNRAQQSNVRQRRQPHTPHPALMQHNIAMATPQPQRPVPIATATPQPQRPVTVATATPQPQRPLTVAMATPAPLSNQAPSTVVPATPQPSLQHIPPGMCVGAAPGPPTPCPILPRERSNVDKMVEYLVSDGPNNRYALICSQCKSHNGMALRDEFEYLTFRCAYCYNLNQARKKRPSLKEGSNTEETGVKERTPSLTGEDSEAVFGENGQVDGNHDDNRPTTRCRHRSRGQRSSSQTSERTSTPTPPDE